MREVPPEELLRQLIADLELIASTSATQRAWLTEHHVPSDELMQQLDDSRFAFTTRLRDARLIDSSQEVAVAEVLHRLNEIPARVYRLDLDGLDEPQWEPARRAAIHALALLQSGSDL